ncbi:hypothetical protein ACSSS7_006468 [Eimeria intestinalis]
MVHLKRCFAWGLVFLGLALSHTRGVESAAEAREIAERVGVGVTSKLLTKSAAKDAYAALIRGGLLPLLRRGLRHLKLEYSPSAFHKLARAWHSYFFQKLDKSKLPEKWVETAAGIYKKLGGEGDLAEAMAGLSSSGAGFNISFRGPLREEFISYAYFFLNAFVPETIRDCLKQTDDQAVDCIAEYEEPLQDALLSTLSAYFHFISSRAPATRIPAAAFVIASVTPCPFGFLVDPTFVYGAMVGAKAELLKPMTSLKRAAAASKCPSMKKALLRVLMASGVTPADFMAKQKVSDELVKFNLEKVFEGETKELRDLTAITKDSLRKDGDPEDAPRVESPEDLLTLLGDIYSEVPEITMEGLMETSLGERIKAMLEAFDSPAGVAYRQRVEAFAEGQKKEDIPLNSFSLEDSVESLAKEIEDEAKENPQRTPLRQKEAESIQEEAAKVLDLMRHFNPIASSLYPKKEDKKDKKDEKDKKDGKGNK